MFRLSSLGSGDRGITDGILLTIGATTQVTGTIGVLTKRMFM